MDISKAQSIIVRTAGRGGLILQKHSPELLMSLGVVGVVASTVLACRATLKVEAIKKKHNYHILDIMDMQNKNTQTYNEAYTADDTKKDTAILFAQTGLEFVKLYGPAVTLGLASLAAILGSQGILRQRNVALVAAYKLMEEGFASYRKRVVDELGVETDYLYANGLHQEIVTDKIVGEDGKKLTVKKVVMTTDPNHKNVYAKVFEEGNPNWNPNMDLNLFFLQSSQTWANNKLQSQGHLFLNEVYDTLGFQRTPAGAITGWTLKNSKFSDGDVDFRMHDPNTGRDFADGYRNAIRLDFNVQGLMYEDI